MNCVGCKHARENNGEHCYECVKGIQSHYEPEDSETPKIEWILKDCPFCGFEAKICKVPEESLYWVTCKRCGAATMPKKSENEAVALWEERLEDRDRDVSRVFKTIRQKLKEAKQNECINDPLGYALYNTWKDREREK